MRKTVVVGAIVGVLALSAATAFAWGPGRGRGYGYSPYGAGPAVVGPTLNAEQVAKIQKIQGDRYAEMAKLRNDMFGKRAELQALFREPTLDQAKIAAKGKEIEALQSQVQEKALAARTAVAEVLTPEQRAQLPIFGPAVGQGFGPGMGMGPMGMGPRMGFSPRW